MSAARFDGGLDVVHDYLSNPFALHVLGHAHPVIIPRCLGQGTPAIAAETDDLIPFPGNEKVIPRFLVAFGDELGPQFADGCYIFRGEYLDAAR